MAERQPYLTAEQIRQLQSDGFTIGAHSVSHPKFGLVPDRVMEKEMSRSCRVICDLLRVDSAPFAFPHTSSLASRRALDVIKRRHPHIGLLFDARGLRRDRPYIFNRIPADQPGEGEATNLPGLIEKYS
jgi:hypothetical protein